MKTWILRASAAAFAAGLMGSLACGSSGMSCGGTNINADDASTMAPPSMQCGPGTVLSGKQCVPASTGGGSGGSGSGGGGTTTSAPVHTQ